MGRMNLPTANWGPLCHGDFTGRGGGEINVVHGKTMATKKGQETTKLRF